jgi:hypothetical protein
MTREKAIEQVFSYLRAIDAEWGPFPSDPDGKKEAREVLLALGVTDDELSPLMGNVQDDPAVSTGDGEDSER